MRAFLRGSFWEACWFWPPLAPSCCRLSSDWAHSSFADPRRLRHGIANLYRPGAHTTSILASIGIGVMFTLSVYYLQHSLLEEIRMTAPPNSPNLFLINITERERDGITRPPSKRTGILDRQALSPSVSAQILTIDGTPLEQIPMEEGARRFLNTQFVLTWARDIPPSTQILEGSWWEPQPKEPVVSVQEFAAQALGLKVGSIIEWMGIEGNIRARVANIRKTDAIRVGSNNQFILSPGALDNFSAVYYGALRVKPEMTGAIQARIFRSVSDRDRHQCRGYHRHHSRRDGPRQPCGPVCCGFCDLWRPHCSGLERCRNPLPANARGGHSENRRRHARNSGADVLHRIRSDRFGGRSHWRCTGGGRFGNPDRPVAGHALQIFVAASIRGRPITAVLTVLTGWIASYGILNRKPLDILRQIES